MIAPTQNAVGVASQCWACDKASFMYSRCFPLLLLLLLLDIAGYRMERREVVVSARLRMEEVDSVD